MKLHILLVSAVRHRRARGAEEGFTPLSAGTSFRPVSHCAGFSSYYNSDKYGLEFMLLRIPHPTRNPTRSHASIRPYFHFVGHPGLEPEGNGKPEP